MAKRRKTGTLRKLADYFATACFVMIVAVIAAWLGKLGEETHTGPFVVMDGDSLAKGETRFRLEGIDAPEYRQECQKAGSNWQCGREAAQMLRSLVNRNGVVCTGLGVDRYDRILTRCEAGGEDINAAMVRSGFAVAYGNYHSLEREARAERIGIWAGTFDMPRDWRTLHGDASKDGSSHGWLQSLAAYFRQITSSVAGWLDD